MSANLGAMLKRLDPRLTIQVFEGLSQEASDGWNNAGTDHAGICEVNYTPTRDADGCVNVGRALAIFEQFEYSKQFWSYAVATDLPFSVRAGNLGALIRSGVRNQSLVRYLVKQALQSMEDRLTALKEFYPMASKDDWRLVEAGIRVQTIKKVNRGAIYFGTEVFQAAHGTLAAVLGASPGASVSVSIALEVIKTCLPELLSSAEGRARMKEMLPTFDEDLKQPINAGLFEKTSRQLRENLQLG